MALAVLTGCKRSKTAGSGKVTTEISATVINAVEAHDGITVQYTPSKGDAYVKVVSPEEYAQQLNVHVEGTKLIATFKPGSNIPTSGVKVELFSPILENITASDGAKVVIADETNIKVPLTINLQRGACVKAKKLTCNNLDLNADGASQIQLSRFNAADVKARATSSAAIYLEGHANDVRLYIGSRSTIRYDKLNHKSLSTTPINETPAKPQTEKKTETPKPSTPKAEADTTKKAA